MIGCAWTP